MDITGKEYIYGIAQDKNGAPYLFNVGELVRCKDCEYYNPPHIQHNDGTRTDYPTKIVTCDIGTNVGGQCEHPFPKTYCTNHERENPDDLQNLVIFRNPTDFCSRAKMKGG